MLGRVDAIDAPQRRVRRLPAVLAVVVVAGPLLLAVPRLAGAEAPWRLVLLAAFDRQALLAAVAAVVLALLARSRVLLAGTAALAVTWAIWAGPQLAPIFVPQTVAAEGTGVRVVTANIYYRNQSLPQALAVLAASDADVVVLQEVDPRAARLLRDGALGDDLHLLGVVPRTYPYGWAILSRFPGTVTEIEIGGESSGAVTLATPAGPLRVVDVHTIPPIDGLRSRWQEGLEDIKALARGGTALTRDGAPLVLAGDFNATGGHLGFRRILDAGGLRDASVVAGRGWISTWPAGRPAVHLDHVLVSEEVGVVDATELDLPGSDHRAVQVDLDL